MNGHSQALSTFRVTVTLDSRASMMPKGDHEVNTYFAVLGQIQTCPMERSSAPDEMPSCRCLYHSHSWQDNEGPLFKWEREKKENGNRAWGI